MFLDPGKLLVIGVVALVVLGPERLPRVARTVGSFWHDFSRWRATVDAQVKSAFPDLPSTSAIVASVRSPLALLDRLAEQSGALTGIDDSEGEVPRTPGTVAPVPTDPAAGTVDPFDAWPTDTAPGPPSSVEPGPRHHRTDADAVSVADAVSMN